MAKAGWIALGALTAGGVLLAQRAIRNQPLVTEIVAGVYAINLSFGGPLRVGNHAYLLDNGEGLLLIDTGTVKDGGDITAAIQQIGHSLADLRVIVVTHWHYDHTGSLYELLRGAPQAVAYMHPHDREAVDGKGGSSYFYGIAGGKEGRRMLTQEYDPTPAELADRLIGADTETIGAAVAPWGLRAMHTPGHTLGSMSYFHDQQRILFPGDAMNYMLGAATAPFIHDVYEGGYERTQEQAAAFAATTPRYILPAHMTISSRPSEWQVSGPRTTAQRLAERVLGVKVKLVRGGRE